jgi:two-component system sensor histidine kinase and response regulator WspE
MLRISVEDDGAGIDLEKIKKKLFIQGLVEENILENLTDSELLEFLFLPDFSTRDFVTEVSGRGVGLDVVRNMVRELGGTVNVKNMRECGTKFILFLPLTLSVISALIVEVSGEPYAFPLSRIDRILKIQSSDILLIEGRQYIRQGDENIGLISCSQVFGFDEMKNHTAELTVIVISDHLGRYGVVVDESVTQRQLSVQALDARMGKVRNMNSAALMENGDPLFIVDVDDMVRSIERIVTGGVLGVVYAQTEGKIKLNRKCILIVDDSLTVREVERNLLESRGYQVEVAVDGMDGWNAVHSAKYDLIITDVDMPRMDGIELVKSIRQDIRLEKLPIMIVSYKDRQEDRSRGLSAGADYYLTKGSMHDDSLLEAVIDLIGEAAG